MRICTNCHAKISQSDWNCSCCEFLPEEKNGIISFAPHISGASEGYDPSWYEELSILESGNFWFRARNKLIKRLFKNYLPQNGKYLEIGCGTGFVLQMVHQFFPQLDISATEIQPEGLVFAKKRVSDNVQVYQMDACAIPFKEEFDIIGAYDVIEHIKDDITVIHQINQALIKNGYVILTVPQHMFLWSKYDEVGCHHRRYSRGELEAKLTNAGFRIVRSTSFNSLLLPLMLVSRYLNNKKNDDEFDVLEELRMSKPMNFMLSCILTFERWLITLGINFPIGGSRVIVGQKIKSI